MHLVDPLYQNAKNKTFTVIGWKCANGMIFIISNDGFGERYNQQIMYQPDG